MVAYGGRRDAHPPQQQPVELAHHEAEAQEPVRWVVQCYILYRIEWVHKACITS